MKQIVILFTVCILFSVAMALLMTSLYSFNEPVESNQSSIVEEISSEEETEETEESTETTEESPSPESKTE